MPTFPRNFYWGAATAAYQIEGAAREDGRGPSIWDQFTHIPGKIENGDTGDRACDHYHLYPEDIENLERLGCNSYRASVAWSRIFPEGSGVANPAGLDFYQRLVDALLAKQIEPFITLYHWDLPLWLQEKGGWANRDLVGYFSEYADCLFTKLGDRVRYWITLNEPAVHTYYGHVTGEHAPGIQDWRTAMRTAHHLLLAHGSAVKIFRHSANPGQIGITLNLTYYEPSTTTPIDHAAARRMDGFWNRWFLDPLFKAKYPEDIWGYLAERELVPELAAADLNLINSPLDFLGVNYYFRQLVKFASNIPVFQAAETEPNPPLTAMGWEIYPEGLYQLLCRVKKEYGDIPVFITENGAAFADQLQSETVNDTQRIEYLDSHFQAAARAIAAGVPLRGFFVWSLIDNFEWAYGYTKRFGLIYIDYSNLKRIWKQSAFWYRDFIKTTRP